MGTWICLNYGKQGMVLAQGDGVNLSTKIDLYGHLFGSTVCGQLEPGIEGNFAIRGTVSAEGAFRLVAGHDAIGGITSMLSWEYQWGVAW